MTLTDTQQLTGAKYKSSGTEIPTYDDGFGQLWISRNSIGINGIVRAQSWEDAYSICEDEFFPEADETVEELVKEYGFERKYVKVIKSASSIPESDRPAYLGAYEKIAEPADYSDHGRLPDGLFLRWETVETPNPEAWTENELFCEAYGFRNNGPNSTDKLNHGIYSKDLNGDSLDVLTPELLEELGIELVITEGPANWFENRGSIYTCPQCEGQDKDCLYCNGRGQTTETHAQEWHRQNAPGDRMFSDNPDFYPTPAKLVITEEE